MFTLREIPVLLREGDLDSLQIVAAHSPGLLAKTASHLQVAAEYGHVEVCRWLVEELSASLPGMKYMALGKSLGNGHADTAEFLFSLVGERCEEYEDAVEWGFLRAVERGHRECAELALHRFDPWRKHKDSRHDNQALMALSRKGMVDLLQEICPQESFALLPQKDFDLMITACVAAARSECHESVAFFLSKGLLPETVKEWGVKKMDVVCKTIDSARSLMDAKKLLEKHSDLVSVRRSVKGV